MGYKLAKVRIKALRRNNIRKHFDPEKVRQIGESLATVGQIVPIIVGPGDVLYDGEYRALGAEQQGIDELLAMISDELLTPDGLVKLQYVSAALRTDLKQWERADALKAIRDANPDATIAELARQVSCDPKLFRMYLSPFECIEAVQAAFRSDAIGISDTYPISQAPPEEQAALLDLKLSTNASRDDLAREGRKRRRGSGPPVRVSRIKCLLSSGVTLTISGQSIGLDELIDALAEARKEALRAHGTRISTPGPGRP